VNKLENQSLKSLNTFGFDVNAAQIFEVQEVSDMHKLYSMGLFNNPIRVISGGSNLLLTQDIEIPVILIRNKGIIITQETNDHVFLKVGAGENWHDFVIHCVERNWGGIENLSLIPGCVGACPIQNIGAYGTEVKDTITSVEVFNRATNEFETFQNHECKFEYRDSIFKSQRKDEYIITDVEFKLHKNWTPKTSYGDINQQLAKQGISSPTIKDVSDAVTEIRKSKLPDPVEIGNSGSFFKNPIISKTLADKLLQEYPALKLFPINEQEVKVAAAWLIDSLGWKGHTENDVGVHEKQALVLINKGNGSGKDILHLARKIQDSVNVKFGIKLDFEVNIW